MSNGIPDREIPFWSWRRAGRYFTRAMRLRCPVCGISPMFPPLRKLRTFYDWFTPNDGCPRCGYPYDREPGYFLMAVWAVNYGATSAVGLGLYLYFELNYSMTYGQLLLVCALPLPFVAILVARHAKALFLAFDHFFDPAEKIKSGPKS